MRKPSSVILFVAALCLLAAVISLANSPSVEAAPRETMCCGAVTPSGEHLAAKLDSMNVEGLWLAHEHVNWETGEPDRGTDYSGPGDHTHCSAFAASAAKLLGVYLLRPPDHGQVLLANAQADWLAGNDGKTAGWKRVRDMREAQHLANEGILVLALYPNPDRHVSGHVGIIRPSPKSNRLLEENGPEMIQAGEHNHSRISVRAGFQNHPGAWPSGVLYYMHPLPR